MYAALQECSTLGIGGWEMSWATQLGGDWGGLPGEKKRQTDHAYVQDIS